MKKQELQNIIGGGGFSIGLGVAIGGLITFVIGVFDGYIRPLACRK